MLLRRALDNLLRNAVEALRSGPVTARARMFLSVRELPSEVRVEVRDSGLGVAAEDRTRIFDPYFTTKSEGTGLGLAIVKKIVLEHGGLILCCPAPEGGACMRIRLPLKGALLGEVDDGAA